MAADEGSEQDRSEQPTHFKLTRARKKGSVARGMDIGYLAALGAFAGFMWIAGRSLEGNLEQSVRAALIGGPALSDGPLAIFALISLMFSYVVGPLALMAGTIFLVVFLVELLQTGGVLSAEPLKPDFNRLNPAKGLKRIFTLRMLIETAKNVAKLCVYGTVAWFTIKGALSSDIGRVGDGRSLFAVMGHVGFKLLVSFVGVAVLFAVIDQLIVRRDFLKKMRMSRREVRREAREREGDPRLKQKRKQLHAEFAKLSQSLRNLKGADVLVTNPQHIAMGLRYDRRVMSAPIIVSVGTNQFAQRLKRLAFIYGIPVVENRILARELYRKSGLNRQIPDHCFKPVADIYKGIRQKKAVKLGLG